MTVWMIPASDKAAQQNYPKTLDAPIQPPRITTLEGSVQLPKGDLFAWGFPKNEKNALLLKEMQVGDICFFYIHGPTGNQYGWAARVREVFPAAQADTISAAFWDTVGFFPYLLQQPIKISASTESLGKDLAPTDSYMRAHPLGSMKLSDEKRGAHALDEFGSFDAWAMEFIRTHAVKPLSSADSVEYFSRPSGVIAAGNIPVMPSGMIQVVGSLFKPRPKKPSNGGTMVGKSVALRRSSQSKLVGDIGEQAVIDHLKAMLPPALHAEIKWVANIGGKPGWDIEYIDQNGGLVFVEVKSTTCPDFQSFEITANELRSAKHHGSSYHLYLVANCTVPERRSLQIIPDPAVRFEAELTPSIYRVG